MRQGVVGETIQNEQGPQTVSEGDMVARAPDNHDDQWVVSAEFFAANYELV